ncbi:hypothetical protein DRN74_01245 [Candidatus Micrarchaeota archaeon]|nr:MAG: hypothetical protein DRN74_01245 [Candidatus Micrarchaeota archaeon]
MAIRISKLYGLDIYTDGGRYIGKVHDIILNLEEGSVVRITTEPLRMVQTEHAKKLLQEKTVLYKNVKSVGDIVIVGKREVQKPRKEEKKVKKGFMSRYSK